MNKLDPIHARLTLPPLGRWLYDANVLSLWERDTQTLPSYLQRLRHRYRNFAQRELHPTLALQADRAPHIEIIHTLFLKAAADGFQTEQLPPPIGSANWLAWARYPNFAGVLKAEEFAAACAGLGLALCGHELGVAPLLLCGDLGTTWRWVRQIYNEIKQGEPAIVSFAMTEPSAGSDVQDTQGAATATLTTTARAVHGGYVLSGKKRFITNGAASRWIAVFATTDATASMASWTCFLIDKSMPGVVVDRQLDKLGQRAADASELQFQEVFVPHDRVVGRVGSGWALCRNVLNYSRPVVGAIAVGIARRALELAAAHSRHHPTQHDAQMQLAHWATQIHAARALVWQAARMRRPHQTAASMAKNFAADVAVSVTQQVLSYMGTAAYNDGALAEKLCRDARLTTIYEGTREINLRAIAQASVF